MEGQATVPEEAVGVTASDRRRIVEAAEEILEKAPGHSLDLHFLCSQVASATGANLSRVREVLNIPEDED